VTGDGDRGEGADAREETVMRFSLTIAVVRARDRHDFLRRSSVGVAPAHVAIISSDISESHLPLIHRLAPALRISPTLRLPPPPTMAATTGGSWICGECGKVCRSRGGLTKHSSAHKKHSRVGQVHDNLHRIYHPTLDGISLFLPVSAASDSLQGSPVVQLAHSFHLERRPPLSLPSPVTTGPPLRRALVSSWLRSRTQQHPSQTTSSTNSSTSGAQR
jgi:hypothetical protein